MASLPIGQLSGNYLLHRFHHLLLLHSPVSLKDPFFSRRKKTFSTYASHLTSVAIYKGTLLFIYSRLSYLYSPNTDKIISVFYTIINPMLNPLIYSLRNKDLKDAAKNVLKPKINPSWDIRFQDSSKSLVTNSSCVYARSCPTLCDPMDYNLPGSFVLEIIQTRILEWIAISSSRESSPPRDGTCISCLSCIYRWMLYPCSAWDKL